MYSKGMGIQEPTYMTTSLVKQLILICESWL